MNSSQVTAGLEQQEERAATQQTIAPPVVRNTPLSYAQAVSRGLRTDDRSAPLFYNEYEVAYDHDVSFSYEGGEFEPTLGTIKDNDAVRHVFKLLEQTHPEKAKLVEAEYLSGGSEYRRQILHGKPESQGAVLEGPKRCWDTIDLPEKSTLVDTVEKLSEFMEVIQTVKGDPDIFCDCEGDNLGRNGTFSLFQVMIAPEDYTWVLDITVLKDKAFDTRGAGVDGRTLREILEDPHTIKTFYDVRNDADAFFSHYNIHLEGIIDMQFMELMVRVEGRDRRVGLDKCMARILMSKRRMNEIKKPSLPWDVAALWRYHKVTGHNYCKKGKGWAVYDERPILPVLLRYAINDVVLLPALFAAMSQLRGLNRSPKGHKGRNLVIEQSKAMVTSSTLSDFDPNGPQDEKYIAPQKIRESRDSDDERRARNNRERRAREDSRERKDLVPKKVPTW